MKRLWDFKRRTQDWTAPSAGCIFKNPRQLLPQGFQGVPAAGWMIEQVGLKGFQVGGAVISQIHANFMMNLGNAKAADVLALVDEVRSRVNARFGVELELEVQLLPARSGVKP